MWSLRVWRILTVLLLSAMSGVAASVSLEKNLDKLAGEALRNYPDLRNQRRLLEAREAMVKAWLSTDAAEISEGDLKNMKRRTRDYEGFVWANLLKRFELANLNDELSQFLFEKASQRNLSVEEFYVLEILLKERLSAVLSEREELSKERLRQIGKGYTEYVKVQKKDPAELSLCALTRDGCHAIDPETGATVQWVYVGAGPAEIRGANRYRLVAYSPFRSGRARDKRWVVYKGGMLGEWKDETVQKQVAAMHLENMNVAREKENLQKDREKDREKVVRSKPALRIEIKELW